MKRNLSNSSREVRKVKEVKTSKILFDSNYIHFMANKRRIVKLRLILKRFEDVIRYKLKANSLSVN